MQNNFIPDIDLLAYLDGEAEPEVTRTIEADLAALQPRLDALQAQQADLIGRLSGIRPNPQTVGEAALNLLPRSEANDVRQQLKRHPHAVKSAEILNQFWDDLAPAAAEKVGLLQQVQTFIAQLIGGDMPSALAMGVRGAQEGIYEAGDYQVVIETDADFDDPSRQIITGLVMSLDALDGFAATLYRSNIPQPIATSDLDEFGNFSFPRLESGSYELIITGHQPSEGEPTAVEIHIQQLQL